VRKLSRFDYALVHWSLRAWLYTLLGTVALSELIWVALRSQANTVSLFTADVVSAATLVVTIGSVAVRRWFLIYYRVPAAANGSQATWIIPYGLAGATVATYLFLNLHLALGWTELVGLGWALGGGLLVKLTPLGRSWRQAAEARRTALDRYQSN
jgi:hypothetical protein